MTSFSGHVNGRRFGNEKEFWDKVNQLLKSTGQIKIINTGNKELVGEFSARGTKRQFTGNADLVKKLNGVIGKKVTGATVTFRAASTGEKKKKVNPTPHQSLTSSSEKDVEKIAVPTTCPRCGIVFPEKKLCSDCSPVKITPIGYSERSCGHFTLIEMDHCPYCKPEVEIIEKIITTCTRCKKSLPKEKLCLDCSNKILPPSSKPPVIPSGYTKMKCGHIIVDSVKACVYCDPPKIAETIIEPMKSRFTYLNDEKDEKHFAIIVGDLRREDEGRELARCWTQDGEVKVYIQGEINFGEVEAFIVLGKGGDEIEAAIESESIAFYEPSGKVDEYARIRGGFKPEDALAKWFSYKKGYKTKLRKQIRDLGS